MKLQVSVASGPANISIARWKAIQHIGLFKNATKEFCFTFQMLKICMRNDSKNHLYYKQYYVYIKYDYRIQKENISE